MATATYDKIATTTLGSAASSITFSSIAASWTDLRLSIKAQHSAGNTLGIGFNGDTGANFSWTNLQGTGTASGTSGGNSNFNTFFAISGATGSPTSPNWGSYLVDIFSYGNSQYKTSLCATSEDYNGSGEAYRVVGLWRSTAAITSISITTNGGTYQTGTTATLYGIKAA